MTDERRKELFAKEWLSVDDFCELYDTSRQYAAKIIRQIKYKVGDRLGIQGRLHVLDYFAFIGYQSPDRYESHAVLAAKKTESERTEKKTADSADFVPLIKSSAYGY